jgi:hypothetical protein
MYLGHVINLGTYSKNLDMKIFDQFIIVDHTHTILKI